MAAEVLMECVTPMGEGPRELFIVEGISAANAAAVARDPQTQAILAVQGKPMNVERASDKDILTNDKLRLIMRTIGVRSISQLSLLSGSDFDLKSVRYDRVLLLTDGDPDGIHASALLLLAFDYLVPELIAAGRLERVRAPLFAIDADQLDEVIYAYSAPHRERLVAKMREHDMTGIDHDYLKSIAGLNADELSRVCLDPDTRVAQVLTRDDAAVTRETLASFGRQG